MDMGYGLSHGKEKAMFIQGMPEQDRQKIDRTARCVPAGRQATPQAVLVVVQDGIDSLVQAPEWKTVAGKDQGRIRHRALQGVKTV